ncbi:MAG: DUF5808 domain-containing protein [Bryobacteraceae bacterium]
MTPLLWIVAIVGVVLALTPKWTRPDLYFAVTVQTDFAFTPQARRILHRYWLEIALHTLIALALANLAGVEKGWSMPLGIGWQMIGSTWAVARARRATAEYAAAPSPVREAALPARRETLPGGWPLALGPLAFVAAAAVYAWIFWERLPQRIPVHWGLDGADRWVDRTPLNVFGFLMLLASFCAVFLLLSYGMLAWSRTISVTGERARGESRFRRVTLWLQIGLPYLVVIPGVVLAFWAEAPAVTLWPVLIIAVIVVALTMLIRMGQGGSRLADTTEHQPPIGDRTPDAAWKWGVFYYNPDDPALVVEKRFGLGYTLNFGNRWSWVLTTALLLPVVFAVAFG